MPGMIRMVVGLIVLMGVAGGFDAATDAELLPLALIGIMAAFVLYSGIKAHDA